MIICHTVPEIWHVTYVTFIFHFGIFLPFYCPKNKSKSKTAQKIKISTTKKNFWRYHHFTHVYHKLSLDDVRFLRYGA